MGNAELGKRTSPWTDSPQQNEALVREQASSPPVRRPPSGAPERLGLSQEKLALVAGRDRACVDGLERDESNITFLVLCRLWETLGCDVAALTIGIPPGL